VKCDRLISQHKIFLRPDFWNPLQKTPTEMTKETTGSIARTFVENR
jgi:hypothetical protein